MRVCDISRTDEVVGTVLVAITPEADPDAESITLDVGKRALDAFKAGDWQALHNLTPPALRQKDPKKAAAAKKAGQTRAANRATAAAAEASQAAQGRQGEPSSDDSGTGATPAPEEF